IIRPVINYVFESANGESALMFGDDCGYIHILYFKNPINTLFDPVRKKSDTSKSEKIDDEAKRIFWEDLKDHEQYVRYYSMGQIHSEYIRKILYLPHNNSIITSSGDSRNSLVISYINKIKKPYIFRLYKGCECFDYNKTLNLLLTGGADYLARIWNPYVPSKNITILEGHQAVVIDVKINDRLKQCYTFSKDAVVKVWDLEEFTCIQTVTIKFPMTAGKTPNFGSFPTDFYTNSNQNVDSMSSAWVLACNDYLCLMRLGHNSLKDSVLSETHNAPLSCAVYNKKLRQLITCADDSSLSAWDIESGRKVFFIADAHEGEEITCISIDKPCRRIGTGARNGIVKIWNAVNGHNIHILIGVDDSEITGIIFIDKRLITVGWSRKIVKYPDIISEMSIPKPDLTWNGSQVHKDDILCCEFLSPNIMCTASYDGEINVWSVDTEKLIICLRKSSKSDIKKSVVSGQDTLTKSRQRSSSSHVKNKKLSLEQPRPVDQLLFLKHRAKENMKLGVLFSSEGGYLYCWSLYGEKKNMAYFYASSKEGESILALSTDHTNKRLICGDTCGQIRIWNIEHYCSKPEQATSEIIRDKPPLLCKFKAHHAAIISCEWIDYRGSEYLITSSTDHTARVWTMNGEEIGIFGQRDLWDIEEEADVYTYRKPNIELPLDHGTRQEKEEISEGHLVKKKVSIEVPKIEQISVISPALYTISDSGELVENRRKTSSAGQTTLLGLTVERALTQQKFYRQERRNNISQVDGKQLIKGGVHYTPYAVLATYNINIPNFEDIFSYGTVGSQYHLSKKHSDIPDFTQSSSFDDDSDTRDKLILPPIFSRQKLSITSENRYSLTPRNNKFLESVTEMLN
ncbi:unnamed protein product, partial [Didymodactylos carnosus]